MKRPSHVMIAFRYPDLASRVISRSAGLSDAKQDFLEKTLELLRLVQ